MRKLQLPIIKLESCTGSQQHFTRQIKWWLQMWLNYCQLCVFCTLVDSGKALHWRRRHVKGKGSS
ncbi:hypothetical protein LINPERHAP1_LOCUS7160 [Linum perenne]